ncbi:hypothetical protein [uncultured Limosilactobacillus sp.]|uniref:hypothetical protein n=1 Tax=uncultured Limosilactobacillus sp. TaxID=2837629 RepID=UPI0025EF879D|nr:hypothetical protein [uncultured Limosilactobacillus sp.]
MSLIWIVIIAVVIVFLIYEAVHRFLIRRATLIVRQRAQSVTDKIVFQVLNERIGLANCDRQSRLVSDIWGKGVLSFEYNVNLAPEKQVEIAGLSRQGLEERLNELARQQAIDFYPQAKQAFKITDWWQGKKRFHMDVTYLMNEASFEYVHDLRKLQES